MSWFSINPTDAAGVELAAISSGNRARFLSFGIANNNATKVLVTIYDGTVGAGTARMKFALKSGDSKYWWTQDAQRSIFPRVWWTAGNSITCNLDGAGDVKVWGEIVREI